MKKRSPYKDSEWSRLWHRELKEGMKPSRWYYDDPSDTGSLYLKRFCGTRDAALAIIDNSDDPLLVDAAKTFLVYASKQLPKTFAAWGIDFVNEDGTGIDLTKHEEK